MIRKQYQEIADYSLECCMASLMNLSIRSAGKDALEALNIEAMSLLKGLLSCENLGVRSFINGTIFSALSREPLRETAMRLRMGDAVMSASSSIKDEDLTDEDRDQLTSQYELILRKMAGEPMDEDGEVTDDEVEEDEVDDMAPDEQRAQERAFTSKSRMTYDDHPPEDDTMGLTMKSPGMLTGEALLFQEYSVQPKLEKVEEVISMLHETSAKKQKSVISSEKVSTPKHGMAVEARPQGDIIAVNKIPRTPVDSDKLEEV